MASLYKRATPLQVFLLRIVEGAVRNYAHHHPEIVLTETAARSIAKRAAGTLCQHIADGRLAVPNQTVSKDCELPQFSQSGSSDRPGYVATLPLSPKGQRQMGGVTGSNRPSHSIKHTANKIGCMAGQARKSGNTEAFEAYATVLRMLAKLKERK